MSNKSYVIAVNMIPYGIKMVVKSTTGLVEEVRCEFEALIRNSNQEAISYLSKLKEKILNEDAFFNKFPNAAKVQKVRWLDFCDMCIDFAVLNSLLNKERIYLIHPEQFDETRSAGFVDLASTGGLDLIPDVPVMRMTP